MQLPIRKFGDPVLRRKGAPVTVFDEALAAFAADMVETMRAAKGIGLAAQQVGRAMQFFVVELKAPDEGPVEFGFTLDGREVPLALLMPLAVANARVEILPDEEWLYAEGCLSFPKLNGEVARRERVRMSYQDLSGAGHEIVCDGLFARCIQHEHDHCQGVLFIDRMEKPDLLKIQARVKQLKRETLRALRERETR
ncbi:MAG: peptide deformylase [Puniceicoccales bacterium]|jgi:peptide deformylase|nr:peptide deformylase [Puniceicoccales bacterium]